MAHLEDVTQAFGGPGIEPRWTRGAKDAVGTAYSTASPVWFTISKGVLTEVFYPTIDRPQVRDLQFLVTDGKTFFHDERRNMTNSIEPLDRHGLGFRLTNTAIDGRYRIIKEIISDPHQACVLIHTRLEGESELLRRLRIFVLLAPHLEVGGWGNNGNAAFVAGREILTANKRGTWLALGATTDFRARSCGYVGTSDGWRDLADNFEMDWHFDTAPDGNIALTAELELAGLNEFTVGLAFGNSLHRAATTLFQSLGVPFEHHRTRFVEQWVRSCEHAVSLERAAHDGGELCHRSATLLLAHEDKSYPGAIIASLGIPWGEVKGDEDLGGYHLVWTRDLVNCALGLLAAGHRGTARGALIYLACSQLDNGGFHQNFWIDGEAYWRGIQLDEVSFPILLAWRLREENALEDFDPYRMVLGAAGYLIAQGPATEQERWEENGGYSPSTLATNIAALVCAACMASERDDAETAELFLCHADFLESHVEGWTVTQQGSLVAGIRRHFIRINPAKFDPPNFCEDPDLARVQLSNQPPGKRYEYPANEIVDAGFLELVRYGIRRPGDPLIEDSLRAVDAVLKVETPAGPCWRRYNHDGYGQRADGGPYMGWGVGRAWPLLTGERGHYELAAGRDVNAYIKTMESLASTCGLLAEQVWDEADRPEDNLFFGKPTGSAMPLMWAHAEYLKLLRSASDGKVFDLIPEVAERYLRPRERVPLEIWSLRRPVARVRTGIRLRIHAPKKFQLHWTMDQWASAKDSPSRGTAVGIEFVDIDVPRGQRAPLKFTFLWTGEGRWEGRDFEVAFAQ